MNSGPITIRRWPGFDEPAPGREGWNGLVARGVDPVIFLSWEWQKAWWESFGRGELLLLAAEAGGEPVAIAPWFTEAGMIYLVGSGGSDYLDLIGDTTGAGVVDALLQRARETVPGFIGFVFYHLPESSPNLRCLEQAAERLGLAFVEEGELAAPALEWADHTALALAAADKKSLLRHERYFRKEGGLEVLHLRDGREILPHLPELFAQHRARWEQTPFPSLFCDPAQCSFYERLTGLAADAGWLRFTRLNWEGRPIAFHFGFCQGGRFLWYKPSFALDLARHSPGEVLLRQLLLAAVEEGARAFDFGLGDEKFKSRFANCTRKVRTVGLYEPSAIQSKTGEKP